MSIGRLRNVDVGGSRVGRSDWVSHRLHLTGKEFHIG
jgi:hypothetical protein